MTWTKSDIRSARKTELYKILINRGYKLQPVQNGNYRLMTNPAAGANLSDVVIKQSFWICSTRDMAGNTIDFFMKVEGKTFHQAMQIITTSDHQL